MDVSAVEDPVQRRALETMIKTYGQTPRQLFNGSHISRAGPKLMMEGELPAAMGLLVQLAFRETREQAKEIVCPVMFSAVASTVAACCALRKTWLNTSSMKWSAAHLAMSSSSPTEPTPVDQRSEVGRVRGLAFRSGPGGVFQPATRGEVRIPAGSTNTGHLRAVPHVLPHDDLQQRAG